MLRHETTPLIDVWIFQVKKKKMNINVVFNR